MHTPPVPRAVLALALVAALLVAACGSTPVATDAGPQGSAGTSSSAGPSASGLPAGAIAARSVPGGATAPVDQATWALADRLSAATYTGDTTSALVDALARAGIAVVPNSSTDPATAVPEVPLAGTPSPVELLDFQAHALAVGAWAGAAWTGAELDQVVALPDGTGAPPLSALLAAYAATADTPAGALARALLAGQDLTHPDDVRFPAVILVLFASDVATDGGRVAAPGPSPSTGTGAVLLPLAGPRAGNARLAVDLGFICAGPSAWIDAIVGRVEQAISLAMPHNTVGAIITGAINWLIHIGVSVVKTLIEALTAPVLGIIRSIAAIATGLAEQIASLLPYAVHVSVSGGTAGPAFVLRSEPEPGSFDVQVSAGDLPAWPAAIETCARAAGIALPDFTSKAVPLTFGPLQPSTGPLLGPAAGAVDQTTTDATGQAHWPFLTAVDPGDPKGPPLTQVDTMPVAVHRAELDELRARLTSALLGQVPTILRSYVAAILAPILDGIQGRLNVLLDARGHASAYLDYHGPKPPSPSPSAATAVAGACGVGLPAGTYAGTLTFESTTTVPPGTIDLGESGTTTDQGAGPVTVIVAPDGSLSGSFQETLTTHQVFEGPGKGSTDTTMDLQGAGVSGTLCQLTLSFASEVITSCRAMGYATCGSVGRTIPLAGLVPALPLGAPTSAGGTLTWTVHSSSGFDNSDLGVSAKVDSTTTLTLRGP